MFKPDKILVPIDFSECSTLAFEQALVLAGQFDSSIRLLHVVRDDMRSKPIFFVDEDKIRELMNQQVDGALEHLGKINDRMNKQGVQVTMNVRTGSPYDEILKEEKSAGVDLIVIASRGRNGLQEFFYGSTTEKVVRRATCSVLVTRKIIDR